MKIKDILKSKSKELVNIASENTTKLFDYPKIKSKQLKDMINLKIREKAIIATKARLIENSKNKISSSSSCGFGYQLFCVRITNV